MKNITFSLILLFMLQLSFNSVHAQQIQFVKKAADFNATAKFYNNVSLGNKMYFSSDTGIFVTDGTAQGTKQVVSFKNNKTQIILTVLNNKLLFVADDGTHGRELWTSDGTQAGTKMVADINPGKANGVPNYVDQAPEIRLPSIQNHAFFFGNNGVDGIELWKTNGDASGTSMVANLNTDPGKGIADSGYAMSMVVLKDKVYFSGCTATDSAELWQSDGSANGTQKVFDLSPGTSGSYPGSFVIFDDKLLFSAFLPNPPNSYFNNLYVYDGNNVQKIRDSVTSFFTPDHVVIGNKLFFLTDYGNDAGLYVTDGTAGGTTLLFRKPVRADINTSGGGKYIYLAAANGYATFLAKKTTSDPPGLWVSDGTVNGTKEIKEFDNYISNNTSFGNKSYLKVYDSAAKRVELWQTNGTTAGTKQINCNGTNYNATSIFESIPNIISPLMIHGTHMYFFNTYKTTDMASLYQLDMWANNISDINTGNAINIYPNPAGNTTTIAGGNMSQVSVISVTGALVYRTDTPDKRFTINTGNWPPGMYIANITLDNGSIVTKKIIKE